MASICYNLQAYHTVSLQKKVSYYGPLALKFNVSKHIIRTENGPLIVTDHTEYVHVCVSGMSGYANPNSWAWEGKNIFWNPDAIVNVYIYSVILHKSLVFQVRMIKIWFFFYFFKTITWLLVSYFFVIVPNSLGLCTRHTHTTTIDSALQRCVIVARAHSWNQTTWKWKSSLLCYYFRTVLRTASQNSSWPRKILIESIDFIPTFFHFSPSCKAKCAVNISSLTLKCHRPLFIGVEIYKYNIPT